MHNRNAPLAGDKRIAVITKASNVRGRKHPADQHLGRHTKNQIRPVPWAGRDQCHSNRPEMALESRARPEPVAAVPCREPRSIKPPLTEIATERADDAHQPIMESPFAIEQLGRASDRTEYGRSTVINGVGIVFKLTIGGGQCFDGSRRR